MEDQVVFFVFVPILRDEIATFVERYTQQVSKKAPLLPIGVAFDFVTHAPRSLGVALLIHVSTYMIA